MQDTERSRQARGKMMIPQAASVLSGVEEARAVWHSATVRAVGRGGASMGNSFSLLQSAVSILLLVTLSAVPAAAIESPTSYGPVSQLDTPIFRIPYMQKLPEIDGTFSEAEWEDASALTGFWSHNIPGVMPRYEHLAPYPIQSWIYAGFDKEHLYIAYIVGVYPPNSWLKARGRFPDVYGHPLYGLMQDDHIEFELRPYPDLTRGYRYGMFKWFVNPIGVISDQHWSLTEGLGMRWQSEAKVRAGTTSDKWVVEMAIPLARLRSGLYAGKDEDGQEIIKLPPPDGTAYRVWFKNGIGGHSQYVVLYDQHTWNTTKTMMILDSAAVGCQINDIGPIMEDIIDTKVTLKNHGKQSQTVRLGFFVENAGGLIYSSYEDANTKEGLLELVPGEVKPIRLKKKFPGISKDDNYLWFDVRSAGQPAKVLYQCRLTKFHSVDPPPRLEGWREAKLESLQKMRPEKKDFDFRYQYSPYTNRLSAIIDRGIHGAADEVQRAEEAKLSLLRAADDEVVVEKTAPFRGDFAVFDTDLPELAPGEYKVSLLLFDANKRIVGERNPAPFYKGKCPGSFPWERNTLGLDDLVWEPFTPIRVEQNTLQMFKHSLVIDPSGLPQQIVIRPDVRELPLDARDGKRTLKDPELLAIGRGPQLRAPMRLEAVVKGQRTPATVVKPAKLVRQWQSEAEFSSSLKVGPLDVELASQYDCDGAMTFRMTYGTPDRAEVEAFELLMDVAGPVDICVAGMYDMEPSSGWEMTLPKEKGIVWDSARDEDMQPPELYYSRFVPWMFFGSGDRGWTWVCDSDRDWIIDRAGSTMTLERNDQGDVTLRVKFVNHKAPVTGKRTIEFALFTHPAKPKEAGYRRGQWLDWPPENLNGKELQCIPNDGPWGIDGSDETFKYFRKQYPLGAPRLYIVANWVNSGIPELQTRAYCGEWLQNSSATVNATPMDRKGGYGQPWVRPGKGQVGIAWGSQSWEDYFVYHCERMIRLGKVPGWWWDECATPIRTDCLATGGAYLRKPEDVKPNELPWQSNFGTLHTRNMLKRLARLFKKNEIPNYTSLWATGATTFESYARNSEMVESACGFAKSYEIDHIVRFPISGWRYASNSCKGLTTRVKPYVGLPVHPGDNPRLDRALLGRVLLHDLGVSTHFSNPQHFVRVVNILRSFGYFDEQTTEMIPYWRSRHLVRYGEEFKDDAFELAPTDPNAKVYVTLYRRPYKNAAGRQGYKVLFVLVNENDTPVRDRLHILNSEALFGGTNNLLTGAVYREYKLPPARSVGKSFSGHGRYTCLKDMEDGGTVVKSMRDGVPVTPEIYGPIYINPHEFRILYGHYDPELPTDPNQLAAKLQEIETKEWQERHPGGVPAPTKPWWETWKEQIEKE